MTELRYLFEFFAYMVTFVGLPFVAIAYVSKK